jgi:putative DNA primase/helicase
MTEEIKDNIDALAQQRASIEDDVKRLAKLAPIEFDRVIKEEAERLGCRESTLRGEVEKARKGANPDTLQGKAVEVADLEAWETAVDGNALLDEVQAAIRKHIILSDDSAVSITLWVVASHLFNEFFIFPRLRIRSPVKGCGKSTLLDVFECLVNKPFLVGGTSAAPLFRMIEAKHPTMLLDESDTYLRDNEDLRNIANNGHKKNGQVLRCEGDALEPRAFSVWSPMVIAGIGKLAGTIEDRSIHVRLQKKKPGDSVTRFRGDRPGKTIRELARKIARWAKDHAGEVGNLEPVVPESLFNRDADNWRPLLAVAEACGSAWARSARLAAVSNEEKAAGDEAKLQVLADIKTVFEDSIYAAAIARDRAIHSERLVKALVDLEGSRWADFSRGKPLSQNGLAHLLDEYGINPCRMRIGKDNKNGYEVAWFADAFEAYLSRPPGGNELEQVEQPCNHEENPAHELEQGLEQDWNRTGTDSQAAPVPEPVPDRVPLDVPVENGEKPSDNNVVPVVPVEYPLNGQGGEVCRHCGNGANGRALERLAWGSELVPLHRWCVPRFVAAQDAAMPDLPDFLDRRVS